MNSSNRNHSQNPWDLKHSWVYCEAREGFHPKEQIKQNIRRAIADLDKVIKAGTGDASATVFHKQLADRLKKYPSLEVRVTEPGALGNGRIISTAKFSQRIDGREVRKNMFDDRGLLRSPDQIDNLPWQELVNKVKGILEGVDHYRELAYMFVDETQKGWDSKIKLNDIHDRFEAALRGLGVDLVENSLVGEMGPFMQSLVWPIINGREIQGGLERAFIEDMVLSQYAATSNRWAELSSKSRVVVAGVEQPTVLDDVALLQDAVAMQGKVMVGVLEHLDLIEPQAPKLGKRAAKRARQQARQAAAGEKTALLEDVAEADVTAQLLAQEQAERQTGVAEAAKVVGELELGQPMDMDAEGDDFEPQSVEDSAAGQAAGAGTSA